MDKTYRRGFFALCGLWLWAVAVCPAAAEEHGKTLSPYFFIDGGDPSVDRLPLERTQVQVDISGVIAKVTVKQTYKNDGRRPINASYVFPASRRAAVNGMKMTIGDHVIQAEIAERQAARQTFEKAKQEGKSASLLEQQRPNVFTMNVANVMPGDRIEVELLYTELLVPTHATYEFVYPTVVGPRYSSEPAADAPENDRWVQSPYLKEGVPPTYSLDIRTTISAGIPIKEVSCPSHEIRSAWQDLSDVRIALDGPAERAGNRDFVLRYRLADEEIVSGLMLYEGNGENFFLLMAQPPVRVRPDQIPAREYVFVLDVSGSMHGFPLDTAKHLLRDLVAKLQPTDAFNVILFSGTSHLMSPRSVPATPHNVSEAMRVIGRQRGGGGTELLQAVKRAMGLPHRENASRTIVVITDGYISAEQSVFQYIKHNLGQANVFSFGIGNGVNRYLVEGIAKAGMGEPFVVENADRAIEVAERFREYIRSPILTNIEVDYGGLQVYDVEPASIPDMLAQRPIVIHGKWEGPAGGTITLSGVTGSGSYSQRFALSRVRSKPTHNALAQLWARTRIANLSDFNFGRESQEQIAEVTSLGLTYSLLTAYTSFVAVHYLVRNTEGPAEDVTQPLPLPEGVSNLAVGSPMGVGSEPEFAVLSVLAAALAAVVWMFGRGRKAVF